MCTYLLLKTQNIENTISVLIVFSNLLLPRFHQNWDIKLLGFLHIQHGKTYRLILNFQK